jgi:hypothetical protein
LKTLKEFVQKAEYEGFGDMPSYCGFLDEDSFDDKDFARKWNKLLLLWDELEDNVNKFIYGREDEE